MTEVNFYHSSYEPAGSLIYSIIAARYGCRWLFVRHQNRSTWEIAGGHIEEGETSDDAACRELKEETGALSFDLECVATYSVTKDGITGYGRLYLADVSEIGPVTDIAEIAEVILLDSLPDNLTYPDIQPILFRRALEHLQAGSQQTKNNTQAKSKESGFC
jgi:8-oxo-dGTP diphosphatase